MAFVDENIMPYPPDSEDAWLEMAYEDKNGADFDTAEESDIEEFWDEAEEDFFQV